MAHSGTARPVCVHSLGGQSEEDLTAPKPAKETRARKIGINQSTGPQISFAFAAHFCPRYRTVPSRLYSALPPVRRGRRADAYDFVISLHV